MKLLLTTIAAALLATTSFADPIQDAAAKGDLAGVQAELDKGVYVNVFGSSIGEKKLSGTPLHLAATEGHKEVAALLVDNGADVNAPVPLGPLNGWSGWTPLLHATASGQKEISELLIAAGADVNVKDVRGMTPLHFAALYDRKEIVKLLLAECADVKAKNNLGQTPLNLAFFFARYCIPPPQAQTALPPAAAKLGLQQG